MPSWPAWLVDMHLIRLLCLTVGCKGNRNINVHTTSYHLHQKQFQALPIGNRFCRHCHGCWLTETLYLTTIYRGFLDVNPLPHLPHIHKCSTSLIILFLHVFIFIFTIIYLYIYYKLIINNFFNVCMHLLKGKGHYEGELFQSSDLKGEIRRAVTTHQIGFFSCSKKVSHISFF